MCVRVNQNGQWLGTPVARGITGNAGATSYSKMCPVELCHQRLPRPCRAVRQPDRSRMPDADVQRQADGRWHIPRVRSVPTPVRRSALGVAAPTTRATRFTAARVVWWTTSACSAARRRRHSSTPHPALRIRAASRPSSDRRSTWASTPRIPIPTPLTYSAIGLPAGLSIDSVTGRITGAPSDAGDYAVGVSVFDGTVSASVNFSWYRHDPAAVHARSAGAGHAENHRRAGDLHGDDAQRLERALQLVLRRRHARVAVLELRLRSRIRSPRRASTTSP